MTLFWHNHFATGYTKIAGALGAAEGARYMAAKASEDPGQVRGQIEMLREQRARQLPRHPDQHRQGHGDARLARRPDQHEGEAAGELRPRDHGAVHDRRRQLHRGRRVRRGARLHRLEPGAARRRRRSARSTTSSSTTRPSTTRPRRRSASPIYPDGSKTIPARAGGQRDAGRHRFHQRARRATRTRRATWRRSCIGSSSASSARSTSTFVNRIASRLPAERLRHEGGDARGAAVARVLGRQRLLRALRLAGRVRRPRAEGHRLDRLLGQRRADAAVEHGADPLSSRPTSPAGTRARRGSRPARCWRG